MPNEKYKRLVRYSQGVITEGVQRHLEESVNEIAEVSPQWKSAAASALDKLSADRELNPKEQWALEAIILPKGRPVVDIVRDEFDDVPAPWTHLANLKDALKGLMPAIGRLQVNGSGLPYGGTGFVCANDLILTNRHVAALFLRGVGRRVWFLPGRSAWLDNKREREPSQGLELTVKQAIFIHPYWDAALLKVGGVPDNFLPLRLRAEAPGGDDEIAGLEVAVIGYPYESPYNDRALQEEIFRGQFGIKRLQPGTITGHRQVVSFGNTVDALTHDASTLGGNSGSAVIDLASMKVIGLHFAGVYLETNYAVPTWQLAQDPHVVDAGVNFVEPVHPAKTQGPVWLSTWEGKETPPAGGASTVEPATERPAAVAAARLPLMPDWMERVSETEMKRLYQRDPEGFYELLVETFGEDEAAQIRDEVLFDASTEGLFTPEPDPDKPELVLIHGILGGHLASLGGGRSWLNLLLLPFENLCNSLSLSSDGTDSRNLQPDGIVQSAYAMAARKWRNDRFRVHEFSFDWRKTIEESADRLACFLREQKKARPLARFVLVAHSMGLVVSALGHKEPDWRQLVDKAVLCGSPLGGSFAIMEISDRCLSLRAKTRPREPEQYSRRDSAHGRDLPRSAPDATRSRIIPVG
jgi:pimeloyl-ACP methyl ester carboxylesterase